MAQTVEHRLRQLESALRPHIQGEVRFDSGARALYSTDGSNYRQVPIGVVIPRDADDVMAAIAICRDHGAPILCRGGGTSLAGQCCNVAVVLDFSKNMSQILEIDAQRRVARVQPGVILDHLRNAAEKHNLTFGPDPATHSRCTIGGMVGNNSCGVHSVMAGKTDENIEALEIVTYDGIRMRVEETSEAELTAIVGQGGRRGEIYSGLKMLRDQYGGLIRRRFPNIPRRVSGYNLNFLLPENKFHVARALVGSEGTCVTTLEVTCRLVDSPPQRVLLVIACRDVYEAAELVPGILLEHPIGLEGFDNLLVECTRRRGLNPEGLSLLPEGGGWLLAEFGAASMSEAEAQAEKLIHAFGRSLRPPRFRLLTEKRLVRYVWDVRESALGAVSHAPGLPPTWEGWEDAAVAPDRLAGYLRSLRELADRYGYRCVMYGHFGDGCVHNRLSFDLASSKGIQKFRGFLEEAADLVLSCGGSLSGEHGDGQARAELLPKMFGPELMEAFRRFKALWDPDWKMNPGKLVRPNPLDRDLRLGQDYQPWRPSTHFKFPQDNGSLAEATLRCVGVGKCRQYQGGVMCPSFRATREEKHSTRGRAHLLWEMMKGEVIRDQWRDLHVKSSLDLCLSCKGCKQDCPVAVDVATYKAEFLSHYYEGKHRPLRQHAFAHIDRWAAMASSFSPLANWVTQTRWLSDVAKMIAGISSRRAIPALARESFRRWFERRAVAHDQAPARTVVLWPDTFHNYFHPQTAIAAVEVLESAGYVVRVPGEHVCCGRPLYDFGMLERAKKLLLRSLVILKPELESGVPIIVLEPSCASVFRDELLNLLPDHPQAQRLASQVFLLAEFLERKAGHFSLPRIGGNAFLHGHCHQKSVLNMADEEAVLHRLGVEYRAPAQGCCGMAGAFGFEKEKYELSMAIAGLELLPALRATPSDWLIIADGFSCREQIRHSTGRTALHLAEVLRRAMAKQEVGSRSTNCLV